MVLNETAFVDKAEKSIHSLIEKSKKDKYGNSIIVTISKIRNLLAMTADIYNEVLISNEKLSSDVNARIDYLRVRFVYECGRDETVKDFVEEAEILNALKEINGSRKNFILFQHYMEALVAFHKYNHKERD